MTKIKTSELAGPALDWAVCEAAGMFSAYKQFRSGKTFLKVWGVAKNAHLHPSTVWAQGGPIIEREGISIVRQGDNPEWVASVYNYPEDDWHLHTEGDTPLIAAMRCHVASKLGDEVDVPEGLG